MIVEVRRYLSNIPEGAVIYGKFTQPFGAGVSHEDAAERLATIIEHNGPNAYAYAVADALAYRLLVGLDFPNDGCEVTFYIYAMER